MFLKIFKYFQKRKSSIKLNYYNDKSESAPTSPIAKSGGSMSEMMNTLNSKPEVRDRFALFAEKFYNQENEKFLWHVQHFRKNYYDKSNIWRIQIYQRICRMFIDVGSVSEINISDLDRLKILKGPINIDIFNDVFAEVTNMLANGVWSKFLGKNEIVEPEKFASRVLSLIKHGSRASLSKDESWTSSTSTEKEGTGMMRINVSNISNVSNALSSFQSE